MPPVFGHGRLRLYLLALLAESPRHGYEVIRLLEERFEGLYAPSAGTVYPRLAKLEQEGLVTHETEGGRKVYQITDAGRTEVTARQEEIEELEAEIRDSVAELAADIADDIRGSTRDLREELRQAAREVRRQQKFAPPLGGGGHHHGRSFQEVQAAKQEWRRAREEAKQAAREQARQIREHAREQAREQARAGREEAREQARRLREDMRAGRQQAKQAAEQARQESTAAGQRIADAMQRHLATGDWQGGIAESLSEMTKTLTGFADFSRYADRPRSPEDWATRLSHWGHVDPAADPVRELERLLDRLRDGVRDTARDTGVTAEQLERVREVLATTEAGLRALLLGQDVPQGGDAGDQGSAS